MKPLGIVLGCGRRKRGRDGASEHNQCIMLAYSEMSQ
jgi:hypothetical protein